MSTNEKELRAEFLRKNSPLNTKKAESFEAPPILPEKQAKGQILGGLDLEENKNGNKLRFWENWNTNHYAGISVALGVLLIASVVISYTGVNGFSSGLNATLTVGNDSEIVEDSVEENQVTLPSANEEVVIEEDVVNGTSLVDELIQEKPPQITDLEGFDNFLNSYGL